MRIFFIGAAIIFWVSSSVTIANASLYCTAPKPPDFYATKPPKPYVPYCVNEYSRTHTCDESTIRSYNLDIDTYNNQLRDYNNSANLYAEELKRYVERALAYAKCEMSNI